MSLHAQDINYHRVMSATALAATTTSSSSTAAVVNDTSKISNVSNVKHVKDKSNDGRNLKCQDPNNGRDEKSDKTLRNIQEDTLKQIDQQSISNSIPMTSSHQQQQQQQQPLMKINNKSLNQLKHQKSIDITTNQMNVMSANSNNSRSQRISSIGCINEGSNRNEIVTTPATTTTATSTYLYDKSNFDHFQIDNNNNAADGNSNPLLRSQISSEIGQNLILQQPQQLQQPKQKSMIENQNKSTIEIDNYKNHQQNDQQPKKSVIISPTNVKNSANPLTMSQKKPSTSSLSSATSSSTTTFASSMIGEGPSSSMEDGDSSLMINHSSAKLNRRQWYHLWLPSYKSRLNQFQRQFSDKIDSREKLIGDFVCAIQRELLLQGRMYVSLNYISFYSNIFGYETIINISYKDIESISKASTVKLFPNAIQIRTNSGLKYFFTSFVSRERAYQLMTKLWQLARRAQPMPWPEIRKLIREAYTTSNLGVDLSDLDDADVEIDVLSKKSKKKKFPKRKRKDVKHTHHHHQHSNKLNSSSEGLTTQADDLEVIDDHRHTDSPISNRHLSSTNQLIESNYPKRTTNADVQTDFDFDFIHSNHYQHHHTHLHQSSINHQCTLIDVLRQTLMNYKSRLMKYLPTQLQVIRFLFLIAIILFVIQIGIYLRFQTLNQKLLQTQQLLFEALEKQYNHHHHKSIDIVNHSSSSITVDDNQQHYIDSTLVSTDDSLTSSSSQCS